MKRLLPLALLLLVITPFAGAWAQNRDVPYWASMRAEKVNMRVGPSAEYRIDRVYQRKGLPVKVVRDLDLQGPATFTEQSELVLTSLTPTAG